MTDFVIRHGSFDLDNCLADGVQAATDASAGKSNLQLVENPKNRMETIVRSRKSGKTLILHRTLEFLKCLDLPFDKEPAAAKDIAAAPDEHIFSMEIRSGNPVR